MGHSVLLRSSLVGFSALTIGCYSGLLEQIDPTMAGTSDTAPTLESSDASDDTTTSGGATSTSTTTGSNDDGLTSSPVDGSSTGEPPETAYGMPDGIVIDSVEINQGIGMMLIENGELVGSLDGPLVKERITMFRVFPRLEAGFEPTELLARVRFQYDDGTTDWVDATQVISEDGNPNDEDTYFSIVAEAEQIRPNTQFSITLMDPTLSPDSPPPAVLPRVPATGEAELGIPASDQVIKVMLVPYRNVDGCSEAPDMSDSSVTKFREMLEIMNPVQRVEITVHDEIEWNQTFSLDALIDDVEDLRSFEDPPPNVYYHGLLPRCGSSCSGTVGIGGRPSSPASKSAADQRVAVTLWCDNYPSVSYGTFAHEVGHNQGRRHVDCGGPAGPDPEYPHSGGDIGVWGWGIHDDRLWEPDTAEFMSYCDPSFTSLYHWESEFDVATELTSWDFEYGIDLEPQRPILRLVIAGGSATLRPSRMRGSLRTDEVLWIYGGRRVLASVYAQRNDVADSDATFLVAELPTVGLQGATRVVRVVGSERIEVPISAVIPPRQ